MLFRIFSLSILCFIATTAITQAAVTPDAATNFISTWNTENSGTSGNNEITIPGTGAGYSYEIYWEDTASSSINGTTTLITANSYTLTFPAAGIYEVQASGTIPRIYFNNAGDKDKILTVEQWGSNEWVSMDSAFYGASNLRVPATDAPDLSGVTSMRSMLRLASAFNDLIDHWDVSNVTNMSLMFQGAINFNQPLNNWDTSSMQDMRGMFQTSFELIDGIWRFPLTAFNQPLDNWDTSNVSNMLQAFSGASSFNQDISNWDVSKVTDFRYMFQETIYFNQPLNSWNTASATTLTCMFCGAENFNQPLDNWDTSNVTSMSRVFNRALKFNQDISSWDTSSVTGMNLMFGSATKFNQDLSTWDVSEVINMTSMFEADTQVDGRPGEVFTKNPGPLFSSTNQDAILSSWAAQSVQSNVPFNLGQKTYTATGSAAIETLRNTYGWTITEEYQAEYIGTSDALVEGSAIQTSIASGDSSTAVTINPDKNCEFLQWSDGNTDNPRTDTMTDNVTVTAELRCVTYSTSAATQKKRSADKANTLEINNTTTTTPTTTEPTTSFVPPTTLEESLEKVKELDFSELDPITDKETITKLIDILLELIQVLTLLMMGVRE